MPIQLATIARQILSEGGKLFGARSQRVSTSEMQQIYGELEIALKDSFTKFKLSRALPSKADHGDVDIVVSGSGDVAKTLKDKLGDHVVDYSRNGDIYSVLYRSDATNKTAHVDFISASPAAYDSQYDYLSYNDFSGVLGVIARRLRFNYGTKGFYKIYDDKKGQSHYIPITHNLRDGLKMLGYAKVLPQFDHIQNTDDSAKFLASTDLFDSSYLSGEEYNRSDRKRIRPGRTGANELKDKLVAMNKHRTQPDDDYYLKTLFPQKYADLMKKAHEIESYVVPKSAYNGKWVLANFPQLKPGPIIGKLTLHLSNKFGDKLEATPEETVKAAAEEYLRVNGVS